MEKLIEIDGKQIYLKAHAGVPLMYKNYFSVDFFADAMKFAKSFDAMMSESSDFSQMSYEDLSHVDMNMFYRMLWIFAKAGKKDLPPLENWLEQFDALPLDEITPPIIQMIEGLMKGKKRQTQKAMEPK